jgi:hypothetical protein
MNNPDLYEIAKQIANSKYEKPSAYKSGFIVKTYKQLGGTYSGNKERPLKRWFDEKWMDVGGKDYPVFRPTVRVNKKTPLLPSEISNLDSQIALKQRYRGERNLPPFKKKIRAPL